MNLLKFALLFFLILGGFFILPKIGWGATSGEVVINELMWMGSISAGQSTADEWIELKNMTDQEIDLSGWHITKYSNSNNQDMLTIPTGLSIAPNGYFLIANYDYDNIKSILNIKPDLVTSTVSLVNNNLQIKLYDGDWQGGANLIDTADDGVGDPLAGENTNEQKSSMERNQISGDGTLVENWHTATISQNFDIGANEKGTPRLSNSEEETPPPPPPPDEGDDSEEEKEPSGGIGPGFLFLPRNVLINELVSDPTDGEMEWVELLNNCGKEINLSEWEIEDGNGNITKLSGSLGTIDEKRFKVFEKPIGNLDNKGDVVILRYGNLVIDQVTYGNWQDNNPLDNAPIAIDPYSLARLPNAFDTNNDNLDWQITTTPTKSEANVITDPTDQETMTEEEQYFSQIIINEILANPLGDETTNEFIELKNIGRWAVDLNNWQIADNSQTKYTISGNDFSSTIIDGNGFFVLPRDKTGLALDNSGREIIKLYQPNGNLLDSTEYSGLAPENQSWSRNKYDNWLWSQTITLGKENTITTPNKPPQAVINAPTEALVGEIINFDGSDSFDPNHEPIKYTWNFGDNSAPSEQVKPIYLYLAAGSYQVTLTVTDAQGASGTAEMKIKVVNQPAGGEEKILADTTKTKQTTGNKTTVAKSSTKKTTSQNYNSAKIVELEQIREYNLGDKVTVKGLVAVEPNILGKTIFYLAGSGLQIYSYYQDFPELKLGDYTQISGTLSEAGGERRLKTASRNDIIVLEHREPPQPHELEIADLNEDTEGWLATIQGEITEIHGSNIYIDDGTEEAKVYIKDTTGIDVKNLSEGQRVKITGIISQTKSGYRLLPRYPSDIEILTSAETVFGATQNKNFINKQSLFNYLAITAVALAIIIIGLLIKNRRLASSGNSSQI